MGFFPSVHRLCPWSVFRHLSRCFSHHRLSVMRAGPGGADQHGEAGALLPSGSSSGSAAHSAPQASSSTSARGATAKRAWKQGPLTERPAARPLRVQEGNQPFVPRVGNRSLPSAKAFGEAERAAPGRGEEPGSLALMKPRHVTEGMSTAGNVLRAIERGLAGPEPKPKLVPRKISQLPLRAASQQSVGGPA